MMLWSSNYIKGHHYRIDRGRCCLEHPPVFRVRFYEGTEVSSWDGTQVAKQSGLRYFDSKEEAIAAGEAWDKRIANEWDTKEGEL